MKLAIGTFNVNNLFSRFNFEFRAEIPDLKPGAVEFRKVQKLINGLEARAVAYEGQAIQRKDPKDRQAVAARIREMNLDILAIQEVEDIDTLRYFVQHELGIKNLYPHLILVEGNDPRLIDLAVLSKYPIGAVTTWQHAVHPENPDERVFGRDLLQVEILDKTRSRRLCTLFNNHFKSHFVPFPQNQIAGKKAANTRRKRQAEVAAKIIASEMTAREHFVVLGDLNDPIDSSFLAPLVRSSRLKLVNGLENPIETKPAPKDTTAPASTAWTHRHKETGRPASYELMDHIWLSPTLAKKQTGAFIHRRSKLTGDGSDHDPAWVEVNL